MYIYNAQSNGVHYKYNNNNNNKFILTKIYISRFVVSIVLRTFIDSLDARKGYYPKGFPCPS